MPVFLFRVLPLITLALLIAGIILIAKGISTGDNKKRFIGMGLIVVFALLLSYNVLMAFAML